MGLKKPEQIIKTNNPQRAGAMMTPDEWDQIDHAKHLKDPLQSQVECRQGTQGQSRPEFGTDWR